ncbi:IMPACT family protein [Natronobiforma cellulositropha]|uniref:IMPACT family protein n=1 Tax=Natronobiforma cellulositropha TaxID=1679076 RepID=UPI0021D5D107|nr:YigZ family protein [Natronobiforma cellulositropha]
MTRTYATVATAAHAEFTVSGSVFIGHVRPVESVEEAESFVATVEAEYADATHNVPAYRVRTDTEGSFVREYASDDGEPTGSAGKPALNVLEGRDLENTAVVVTRYYGGTNLGVGGLVRAYSRAAAEAIDAAGVVEERPHERLAVTVAYDDSGTVRGILESEDLAFDAAYEETVSFDVRVPSADAPALRERIQSATSGRATLE